jgi:two-component system KDP operon response regulator KdpE
MIERTAILVIEDEPHTRALLQVTLAHAGYQCLHAATGLDGVTATLDYEPNVVLLDLGLPDFDGVEVTRRIRERSAVPIIVISARGTETDKIAALDCGANDYVTKPFQEGELLARVRVALRQGRMPEAGKPSGTVRMGELSVDFDARLVTLGSREVKLTPIEYRLLTVLIQSGGHVLTHQQILRQVWGPSHANDMNYLRVYMKKLRFKLEEQPARPKYFVNEPGVGYRLRAPE